MTGSEPRLHGLFIFRMTGNGLLFKVVAYLLLLLYAWSANMSIPTKKLICKFVYPFIRALSAVPVPAASLSVKCCLCSVDNVILLYLFFQLAIIGVKTFLLRLQLFILCLQGGDAGELAADLRRLQCLCRRFMEDNTPFMFCPVLLLIPGFAVGFIEGLCLLVGSDCS